MEAEIDQRQSVWSLNATLLVVAPTRASPLEICGLDLVPEEERDLVSRRFVAEIEKQEGPLATGFL